MQDIKKKKKIATLETSNLLRYEKLRIEDLGYFDLDYKSEYNEFIVSFKRYIYYRDIFI